MTLDKLKLCLSHKELNFRQLGILMMLKCPNGHELKFSDIACELKISKPAISRAFDNLVTLGLIDRETGKDKRTCMGILTGMGRDFIDQIEGLR